MKYEVDVCIGKPLDERTRRFLETVQHSANRVIRFAGGQRSLTITVEVTGAGRTDALRAAAGEVARIFPGCVNEKYGEPRET
ncbi:MAG: hypothetical protein ACRDYE_04095 [Acidimicrobiales bacterium]